MLLGLYASLTTGLINDLWTLLPIKRKCAFAVMPLMVKITGKKC